MLHVTNGDSVVDGFREGGIPGTYLPWRDVLHDGAVPHFDTLEALSDVRAGEIARLGGWGDYATLRTEFATRDATLSAFAEHDEVVLWFEHDLYDQLQLLQLLAWFSEQDLSRAQLSMIQIGSHPEVTPFYGLGQLSGAQLAALLPSRRPVTSQQLALGREGWTAFCAAEPSALRSVAGREHPEMPFLQPALARFLEEHPSPDDRLSRSERQLLEAAAGGARSRRDLYVVTQQMEPWPWGDSSVYLRLDGLAGGERPALDRRDDTFALNDYGRLLLAGNHDAVGSRTVDTWLGGVHVIIR